MIIFFKVWYELTRLILFIIFSLGCTSAGVWSALTAYMCTVIPPDNLATMQGILHGVYWGLGSGCGSLIGGFLVQKLGAPMTFWIFASASAVNLFIFLIAQKASISCMVYVIFVHVVIASNSVNKINFKLLVSGSFNHE